MMFEMAHRPRGTYEHTVVKREAATPWAAVEALRTEIPEGELVLYIIEAS